MANVKYYYRSKLSSGPLTLRLYHKDYIDLFFNTGLVVPKKAWDQKKQRIRNAGDITTAAKLNEKLLNLEVEIISAFNIDYTTGEEIESIWLKKIIFKAFNRPLSELDKKDSVNEKVFFLDFCNAWIKENLETGRWKNTKTKKPLSPNIISHYKTTTNFIEKLQQERKKQVKIKDVDITYCEAFCLYLKSKNYGANYIHRQVVRLKFFLSRAEEENLEVNKVYKNVNFSAPKEETTDPYLNEDEIQDIINLEISDDWLDNVRDWFVIGLHTGLRVSDLLGDTKRPSISRENLENNLIQIKTKKTKELVAVPMHDHVVATLAKRNGEFPNKISHKHFNESIKKVCELAGITQEITASIKDPETNRKSRKMYPKYEAVSSHICRRSFATNNYGKMPSSLIMKIGGWRTESAFLGYIKKSNIESAQEAKRYWDKENKIKLSIEN